MSHRLSVGGLLLALGAFLGAAVAACGGPTAAADWCPDLPELSTHPPPAHAEGNDLDHVQFVQQRYGEALRSRCPGVHGDGISAPPGSPELRRRGIYARVYVLDVFVDSEDDVPTGRLWLHGIPLEFHIRGTGR